MWGSSSNASGVAHTMGFKVNSIFQILFFISFRKYMKNKGSTWWTGAFARLHVTKYDVLMLVPLHICSSWHVPSAFQDSGHGRCRWCAGKCPLPGWWSVCWNQALQGCDSEAHGAGGRTRSVPTTSLRWIPSFACERCAMPLASVRGPSDALQERLPGVERAFVHLDYEFTHQSEHARSHDT